TAMVDPWTNPFVLDLNEERYPRRTMTFIRERRLPAPVFNTYAWGGYELWRLYPDYQVFMDGRTHVYGSEVLRDFLEVTTAGERWPAVLAKWRIQTVLATRDSAITSALEAAGSWRPVFAERDAVVFVRESPDHEALLRDLPAVSLARPDPVVGQRLAEAMRAAETGDEDLAVRRLREVLAASPDQPVALFSLGVILAERGATAEARTLLERVVAAEPGGDLARRAQDRLTRLP
ncbi:MAG TPA: tetratricopeptide repeat protein, partial [Methylomirabilota bacterium]|nr:tetratricopeptide repeat protein [Methylomirabilota bacterium]